MSTAPSEIQALKVELAETQKRLEKLERTLDAYFSTLSPDQYRAWKRAKSGETETPTDTMVSRNLPAAVVRTELNGIGL